MLSLYIHAAEGTMRFVVIRPRLANNTDSFYIEESISLNKSPQN